MSGIFSVPFAALAVFAPNEWGKPIWAGLAILAAGVTIYRIWASERSNTLTLAERLRSKLKVDCGPNVEDSVTRITRVPIVQNRVLVGEFTARYYRLKVETDGVAIVTSCRADLTRIEHDGARVWGGDEAVLTFAPGESPETAAKTIRDKISGWVDVIYIQNNEVAIPAVVGRNWRYGQVFKTLGEYVLTVVLSADDMPSMEIHLKFKWTGNWDTSELVLIPGNAVPGSVTEASCTVASE